MRDHPTLIAILIAIAILGVIAVVVALNVTGFFGDNTHNITADETTFYELAGEPITSLNMTGLNFMVDYCGQYAISTVNASWESLEINEKYVGLVAIYQNQIIIRLLQQQEAI